MSKFFDWEAEGDGSSNKGGQFLKLEAGKKYRVRPVGKPIKYLQHWEPVRCRSPYMNDKGEIIDPLMLLNKEPKKRYAYWIMDRDDESRLKIMDFSSSILDAFKEWKEMWNEEPGGHKGGDWQIKVIPGAGGDRRKNKYIATFIEKSPFTDEEKQRISEAGDLAKKLMDARKPNTPDEIRAMLSEAEGKGDSVPASAPVTPAALAKASAQVAPQAQAVPATAVTSDLTDW